MKRKSKGMDYEELTLIHLQRNATSRTVLSLNAWAILA